MSVNEWLSLSWQQIMDTELVAWIAVVLGIVQVLLAKANKIWLYPAGIGSTLLSVYILSRVGLYAESLLNVYYVIMSIYGWWHWIKKKNKPQVQISYCNQRDWFIVALITVLSFSLLALVLKFYTPSTVPFWDAWVSATAWAGMWLLSKRKIENWILLNISNLFAIPLLVHKQLPLFAALTLFLFIVAIVGFYQWRTMSRYQKLVVA